MQKRYNKAVKWAVLTALLVLSCSRTATEEKVVVASVGSSKLYLDDVKKLAENNSGLELSLVQVQNYLQRWMEKELIYQQAAAEGFLDDPEIKKKLREVERDYLFALYVQKKVDDLLTVSDDEVSAYYFEKSKEFIRQDTAYDLQLILVGTSSEAETAYKRITGGEDFGSVARDVSLDDSKSRDGRIGWTTLHGLPEELRRRIPLMKVNELSRPIQTPIGIYIVQLNGVRPRGEKQSLDEVRPLIEMKIKASKREDQYRRLIAKLQENADASINWALLNTITTQ